MLLIITEANSFMCDARRRIIYAVLFVAVAAVLCAALFYSGADTDAATVSTGVVNDSEGLWLRAGPGTNYSKVRLMSYGQVVNVVGTSASSDGVLWYHVTFTQNSVSYEGYCHPDYLSVTSATDDSDFEAYLTAQNFPESYKPYLRALHAQYPDWVFVAYHTNLNWSTVVSNECVTGRNLVPRTSNSAYINTADVDSNGYQIGRSGDAWVQASEMIIKYQLDPRNFLNDPYIFQFEKLSYSSSIHTVAGVEQILAGTFMSNTHTVTHGGVNYTYAQIFMIAAQSSGVSPYHLAARVRQEQGTSGSSLSSGTVSGYSGYYNFFNIGATTGSGNSVVVNGAIRARSEGWTDQYLSIVGGAKFLSDGYISVGQDTLYFQKFDVISSGGLYWHQYMQNVFAAANESSSMRSAYSSLNTAIVFSIPVYLSMPGEPSVLPSDDNTPSADTSYTIGAATVTGISPGTSVATALSHITVENGGSARVLNSAGSERVSGNICSGDSVQLLYADGSVYKTLTVVIYGDTNGDGNITITDLLRLQKYLLDAANISGGCLSAADINHDGTVNVLDLLRLQKHLLSISSISQG